MKVEREIQMKINAIEVVDEMLRSLRAMAVPVVLLAAASLVGCGDSGDACKDACDGTDREIEVCRAACDGVNL